MNFLVRLLVFTAMLGVLYYFLQNTIPEAYRYRHVYRLFVFFVGLMALFNLYLTRPSARGRSIVTRYMGATTVKFLLCLAVIAVFVLRFREQAAAFTLHFMSLYLLYTAFETVTLYRRFQNER